jgi:hypothetical protein
MALQSVFAGLVNSALTLCRGRSIQFVLEVAVWLVNESASESFRSTGRRRGQCPILAHLLAGEGMTAWGKLERIRLNYRGSGGDVSLRDAVLPCEVILIPQSP